jgi:hypothetical protein
MGRSKVTITIERVLAKLKRCSKSLGSLPSIGPLKERYLLQVKASFIVHD